MPRNNANRAKKRKKRNSAGSSHSEDNSDHSSDHGFQPLSSVLKEANEVIYEASDEVGERASMDSRSFNPSQQADYSEIVPGIVSNTVVTDILQQVKGTNKKIDGIVMKLNKLDLIEKRMASMESVINEFRNRVVNVETKTRSLQESMVTVNEKCAEINRQKEQIRKLENDMKNQECEITEIKKGLDMIKDESENVRELKEKVTDLRCRSMKQNLVFTGLSNESRAENTEDKLRNFLFHELGIEDHIEFANVHRFGRFVRGKDRPIVARFLYNNDLLNVKYNAYKLKGSQYGISEQFPQEVENRRKQLYPIMKRHKSAGDNVKLVRDRLYINNELYVVRDDQSTSMRQQPQSYRDALTDAPVHRLSESAHRRPSAQDSRSPSQCQQGRSQEVRRQNPDAESTFVPSRQNTSSPLNPLASAYAPVNRSSSDANHPNDCVFRNRFEVLSNESTMTAG